MAQPTTGLRIVPTVYVREEERAKILEALRDEPDDANFGVITIVGTEGSGQTTTEVYNDVAVKDFTPKAWVSFSDDFNAMKISKSILECITSNPCDVEELNVVQNLLRDALNGKKFLIVLDDVRGMSPDHWETLKAPFVVGAPGSKIIVTVDFAKCAPAMRAHMLYLSRPDMTAADRN